MGAATARRRQAAGRRRIAPLAAGAVLAASYALGPVPAGADAVPTVSISSPRVLEGNAGPSPTPRGVPTLMTFTVTLSAAPTLPASVQYSTFPLIDAGQPGADFEQIAGKLAWAPGDAAAKTFDVPVWSDTEVEVDEEVGIRLSEPISVAFPDEGFAMEGVGTIRNDDRGPRYSFSSPSVCEGAAGTTAAMTFEVGLVDLPGNFTGRVTADWLLGTREAYPAGEGLVAGHLAGADFLDGRGTLVWDNDPTTPVPGYGTKQQVSVTVLGDDTPELDEGMFFSLNGVTNSGYGWPPVVSGLGVIRNDDGAPCG